MEFKFRDWLVHPIKSFKKQQAYVRRLEDYALASKPAMSFATGATDGVNIPYFDGVWRELEDISLYSDLLRTVHLSLKSEILRNGFDKENINVDTEVSPADEIIWNKFVCKANSSGQTLRNVFGQLEDDTNVFDDRYLMAVKDYLYQGNFIVGSTVKEFIRMHPAFTRIICDRAGNRGFDNRGVRVFFSPKDRKRLVRDVFYDEVNECYLSSATKEEVLPAHFRFDLGGANDASDKQYLYYGPDEVLHSSRYRSTLLYGFSPVLTLWVKVMNIFYQDKYMQDSFKGQRPPKGLIVANTRNADSAFKQWDATNQWAKNNPGSIPMFANESVDGNNTLQFISFMNSLSDMEFTPYRDEVRKAVGSLYGVSPIFQNDVSTSGGLNNEGLQITVTNRAVEDAQRDYNEKDLRWVARQLNITSFYPILAPSEEQDEVAEQDLFMKKLVNVERALNMGMSVTYDDKIKEFTISGDPQKPEVPSQGGFSSFDNNDFSGTPQPFDLGKGDIIKSLPDGAIPLKPGQKVPKGAREITGPKGGKYYVPNKGGGGGSDSSDRSSKLNAIAKKLYDDVDDNHKARIGDAVEKFNSGNDTKSKYFVDGVWSSKRKKIHYEITKKYHEAGKLTKSDGTPKVVFMAGLPASGKTYSTQELYETVEGTNGLVKKDSDGVHYLVLNADDIKEGFPEYDGGLGAAEVHNESSELNKAFIKHFSDNKHNIIIDGTLAKGDKAKDQLNGFKKLGYNSTLIHVQTPAEKALEFAHKRYKETGRFVPYNLIIDFEPKIADSVSSIKGEFDSFKAINKFK